MPMFSRDGSTVLQVDDDLSYRRSAMPWNSAAIVGVIALVAVCAYSVVPLAAQLELNTSTRLPTATRSLATWHASAKTLRPSLLSAYSQDEVQVEGTDAMAWNVPRLESPTTQANYAFTGIFALLGAALAFVRGIMSQKSETLALLPISGTVVPAELEDDSEIFTFDNLKAAPGSRHRKKRKGRGHAAGQGATCGFGTRGQKSRSGNPTRPGFEGGQNPLWRRTPKLRGRPMGPGHKRKVYQMIPILGIASAAPGSTLQFDDLSGGKPVLFKVGGANTEDKVAIPANLVVKAHAFTSAARSAIEEAGGKCIVIDKYSRELDADGKVVVAEPVAMACFTSEIAYMNNDLEGEDASDMYLTEDSSYDADFSMFAATATRSVRVGKYREPTPLTSSVSPKKVAIINQVHDLLKGSFLVFGFSLDGINMAQISKLRRQMPPGTKVQVVKNTLFRLASRGTGFEAMDPLTIGSKAWVFVPESCFQEAIKVYSQFLKETKRQDTNPIIGGGMESTVLSNQQVVALSDMPTKKELIEQAARLIKGIQTKVAVAVKATPKKLAVAIKLATLPEEDAEKPAEA